MTLRTPALRDIVLPGSVRLAARRAAARAHWRTLRSFVLPGGSAAAAHLHMARTVSRRAERLMTALAEAEPVNRHAMVYMNRLSDFFFVASRWVNDKGAQDVLWVLGDRTEWASRTDPNSRTVSAMSNAR